MQRYIPRALTCPSHCFTIYKSQAAIRINKKRKKNALFV